MMHSSKGGIFTGYSSLRALYSEAGVWCELAEGIDPAQCPVQQRGTARWEPLRELADKLGLLES